MVPRIEITRQHLGQKQITGKLRLLAPSVIFECFTLELPWLNNTQNISCIPFGTYAAIKHQSPKFGNSIWLQDVPGRSQILIHRGNFYSDIRGCILVGDELKDINGDGLPDVTNSRKTMDALYNAITSTNVQVVIK